MAHHSTTCPRCGATMTNVVVTSGTLERINGALFETRTLKAGCDTCGWTGSKHKSTPHEGIDLSQPSTAYRRQA